MDRYESSGPEAEIRSPFRECQSAKNSDTNSIKRQKKRYAWEEEQKKEKKKSCIIIVITNIIINDLSFKFKKRAEDLMWERIIVVQGQEDIGHEEHFLFPYFHLTLISDFLSFHVSSQRREGTEEQDLWEGSHLNSPSYCCCCWLWLDFVGGWFVFCCCCCLR